MATNESFSVLIPDGECNYAISVIRCLGQHKNVKTFVLSTDKNAPSRFSRFTSQFIFNKKAKNKEEKIAAIIDGINKTKADVLLPLDVETIRLVSEHKEKFSDLIAISPTPGIKSFDIADDKWLLSIWLKENNIPHPKTTLFNSTNTIEEAISELTLPLIIKPRNGSGGRGIKIIRNSEDLKTWKTEYDHSDDQIIQSYIKGYDIDCSVLCSDGEILAHTIQKSLKYETDNPWPYGIEFLENDELFQIVKKVVEKFKWSGVVHIDLRYDEDERQYKLIEMNPRFWASVSASVFAGANFPYLSCLSGLKREIPAIKIEEKRVVRSGPAIKMTLDRLFTSKKDLSYDNTFFEFIIRDPLPAVIGETLTFYNKITKR